VAYILILKLSDCLREDKIFWTAWQQHSPNLSALNILVNAILICYLRSKMLDLCHIFRRIYHLTLYYDFVF
jgi:hypothetical protein